MHPPADSGAWLENTDGRRVAIAGDCSLGRSSGNDVHLNEVRVSRRHALIHAQGDGECWLVDLGSSNGTFVNRARVIRPRQLHEGDHIQISSFELVFRRDRPPPLAPPPSTPPVTVFDPPPAQPRICWLVVADIVGSTQLLQRVGDDEFAMLTGRWFSACQQVLWQNAGEINKYLGDGFFAYWPDAEAALGGVVSAIRELQRLQEAVPPPFRIVIHHGQVLVGGPATVGEESLSGKEVTFTFRMESLAAELRIPRLFSAAAAQRFGDSLPLKDFGFHSLPGFAGLHGFSTS